MTEGLEPYRRVRMRASRTPDRRLDAPDAVKRPPMGGDLRTFGGILRAPGGAARCVVESVTAGKPTVRLADLAPDEPEPV